MKVNGVHWRPVQAGADGRSAVIIDQTKLPHVFETATLRTVAEAAHAIRAMLVRGAPLIGATAAFGVALGMQDDPSDAALDQTIATLAKTRPTAVNLFWALERMRAALHNKPAGDRAAVAWATAQEIADEDVAICSAIGDHGLKLIAQAAERKGGGPVNILTHCNAGWLATVDWGTALAPIYKAFDTGIDLHVWVDETRPRNQGAALTAWELGAHGVPLTVVVDNAGGHLMQHGQVDLCIVGTDRTTRTGDVCNKIGTYLKALAAHDNGVPFYVALPGPTIDWSVRDGVREIPIEERNAEEVGRMSGRLPDGEVVTVDILPHGARAGNPAFDVTPARLVTGLITERGVAPASEAGLLGLYPEQAGG
ncbi:MAG: S-methyl-5-thioribose-1-phosphate isomerase [Pseudomonadota bacterium]|nr:S-methyl-5-thioribose-1-phosphate isomerase [Pseudomonadota bacterium]